jgi:hypothetical protein
MTQPTILIVKTGDTFADLIGPYGDFEDWIRRGMGVGADQVRVQKQVTETPEAGQLLARFASLCSHDHMAL